jgi:hypothetical protein
MKDIETINIVYVAPQVEELDGGYAVQIAGFVLSGKDSKRLRSWSLPDRDIKSAETRLNEWKLAIAKHGNVLMFNSGKKTR